MGVAQPCLGRCAGPERSQAVGSPPPGRRGAQPSPRPRESFRLDRSAPAHPSACLGLDRSGSGRVGVAVFTHNRRNYGTRPRRGGRRCHHRVPSCTPCVLPRGQLEGCHAMGHPADQIPPSLGAPAVRSHCVRMDGGMGGVKVKTQTKSRPCAKFPAASKFFWNRAGGGGEHGPATTNGVTYHGSSPRGREHPGKYVRPNCLYRPGHPRVGGEHYST